MDKDESLAIIGKTTYRVYLTRKPFKDYKQVERAYKFFGIDVEDREVIFIHFVNVHNFYRGDEELCDIMNIMNRAVGKYSLDRIIYLNLPELWLLSGKTIGRFVEWYSGTTTHEILHDFFADDNEFGDITTPQEHFLIGKLLLK